MAEVRGGLHYPRSIGEFQTWFRTDADCLDYLEWLRWPHGFECANCDGIGGWRTGDRRIMCAACGHRTSVTAWHDLRQDAHTADRVVHGLLVVRHG